ncbi:DUF6415 family natural product biosynthesis protein [Streptomyces sp. NPDC058469]|uniref:DUF6415 family natural product biosynthesis protein n=1 Tax=Streptomyces sp. NPDC058469 TaxID=3346514 RepID=UPI003663347F
MGTLLVGLRRFLANEAIDDELWDDLDAVLGEFTPPASHEIAAITARFRRATTTLVEIVPSLVRPYPLWPLQRLIFLSAEHPSPEYARGHLNRLAMGILDLLELMGDDAV